MDEISPERMAEVEAWEKSTIDGFMDQVRNAIQSRCQIAAIDGNWLAAAEDLTRYTAERMFTVMG